MSDIIIDTSELSVHDLRRRIEGAFARSVTSAACGSTSPPSVSSVAFPVSSTCSSTCGFYPTRTGSPELRPHTGLDAEVRDYVMASDDAQQFVDHTDDLLEFPPAPLRGRGQEVSDDRDRLHRRADIGRSRMAEELARRIRSSTSTSRCGIGTCRGERQQIERPAGRGNGAERRLRRRRARPRPGSSGGFVLRRITRAPSSRLPTMAALRGGWHRRSTSRRRATSVDACLP